MAKQMRAATKIGANKMILTEVDVPAPGPGEMILRVERAGICGTDLHTMHDERVGAAILGHEFAGTIVDVGSSVDNFKLDQRVCSMPTIGCGKCLRCLSGEPRHCQFTAKGIGLSMPLNGAFAEYVLVGQHETFVLPQGVDAAMGALVEPLAVGLKNVEKGQCIPGDQMLIIGGGPVGLATALWARALGVCDIIVSDPLPGRRSLALQLGATAVVDPTTTDLAEFCRQELGTLPNVVIECTGRNGSFNIATSVVPIDGRIVISGLHMEPEPIQRFVPFTKNVKLAFSFMYEKRHYTYTLKMLAQGRIDARPLVTHEIPLAELPGMFDKLNRPNDYGKVLVIPGK